MAEQGHYIPKYLNAMPQFLWWEVDEVAFLFIFTGLGVLVNNPIIGALIGYILMKIYVKAKARRQKGYLWHKLYALGLYKVPGIPDSWMRIFYC